MFVKSLYHASFTEEYDSRKLLVEKYDKEKFAMQRKIDALTEELSSLYGENTILRDLVDTLKKTAGCKIIVQFQLFKTQNLRFLSILSI